MNRQLHPFLLVLSILFFGNLSLQAQPVAPAPGTMAAALRSLPPGILDRLIKPFEPLKFATEVKKLSVFSSLGNAVFQPDGEGPFPAIVVTHSCGGVDTPNLRERMNELLNAGYLVLMLDSFKPRGQKDCRNGVITGPLVWRDAVDALAHLHTLKEVDKTRIYQVGYSMGSQAAAALSSPSVNAYFNSTHRFRASVGWYAGCGYQHGPGANVSHYLRADTDHPIFLLIADADKETPTRPFCFPLLDELKAAGKPVEWHIYGGTTTHAWDLRSGYTMTNGWGEFVVNTYDANATVDATQRTLAFLKRNQ